MTQPVEIERKFLVRDLPALSGLKATEVRQGYLTTESDSVEIRLRQKGTGHFLTVKSLGGVQRSEHEIAIDSEQFTALWPTTDGRRVEKTRYVGQLADGAVFELDVFAGALAPLVLVEVEFTSLEAAEAFAPPEWFGKDVTSDKSYKNKALAVFGRPGEG